MSINMKRQTFLFCYIFFIFCVTLLDRTGGLHHRLNSVFFSTYIEAIKGNKNTAVQIILNIGLFIPLGFSICAGKNGKMNIFRVTMIGLCISLFVEGVQYFFCLGLCEVDDLIDNTLGAVMGGVGYYFTKRIALFDQILERISSVLYLLGLGSFLVFSCVFCKVRREKNEPLYYPEKEFQFQIDAIADNGGQRSLKGICFIYDVPGEDCQNYSIVLKSCTNGKRIVLNTRTWIRRNDVAEYFLCEKDYSYCGFEADLSDVNLNDDYEIFVFWKWRTCQRTGSYLLNGQPSCVKTRPDFGAAFHETWFENVLEEGTLLLCEEDYSCWVYQYEDFLYWVAGEHFVFDKNRNTMVEYQLWTTQNNKLPNNRTDNGWNWDNYDFCFEKYEIKEEYGTYRVAVYQIPKEYSITYIMTGYCVDVNWYWMRYFRPRII